MAKTDNKLFIEEEDDAMNVEEVALNESDVDMLHEEIEINDEDDDPIVQEFPLNLAGKDENLHIFQYANKSKVVNHKLAEHPVIAAARYKSKSSLWELDVPLDTKAFFNETKAEDDWNGVKFQTLKGVGVENEGQYAAFVSDGQAYLVPVKTVSQLRPFFKYIDEVNLKRKQEEFKQNPTPASQRAQVVTMSVKSVNDTAQNRLAGSLLAHKVAEEELPIDLTWAENTFDQFKEAMVKESSEHILKTVDSEDDYLKALL